MLMPWPRLRFYAGLGFVTAATLMLQIVETRIISVTSWYHLAFFVISIAMFGLTAGAVWVYLRRERFAAGAAVLRSQRRVARPLRSPRSWRSWSS